MAKKEKPAAAPKPMPGKPQVQQPTPKKPA
jgi:hypothetical protein